jgi:hypothetical protein
LKAEKTSINRGFTLRPVNLKLMNVNSLVPGRRVPQLPRIKVESNTKIIVGGRDKLEYGQSPLLKANSRSPGPSVSNSIMVDDMTKNVGNITQPVLSLVKNIESTLDGISNIDKFYKDTDLTRRRIQTLLQEQYSFFDQNTQHLMEIY